jgi:hypothetical protein
MTNLQGLQTRMTAIFDQAGGSIDPSSGEFTRRTTLLNESLKKWASIKAYTWRELVTTDTLTTVNGQSYVELPDSYKFGNLILPQNGLLTIGADKYPVLEYGDAINRGTAEHFVYVTGNPGGGYRLNISPTPTEVLSIPISFYSEDLATDSSGVSKLELSDLTDIPKCPNENWLVYNTLAQMFLIDDEGDQYQAYTQMADKEMSNMLINNVLGEDNQGVNLVFVDDSQGYESIGGYLDY